MDADVLLLLAPDAHAPRAARVKVVEGLMLKDDLAADAALLVSEAVTNSVLHAALPADGTISVRGLRNDRVVRVEVSDTGAGMSKSVPPQSLLREGGRGLNLIASIARRWGIDTHDGTTVWFELPISTV